MIAKRPLLVVAAVAVVVWALALGGGVLGRGAPLATGAGPATCCGTSAKLTVAGLPQDLGGLLRGPLADLYIEATLLESAGLRTTRAAVGQESKRLRDAIALGSLRLDAGGAVQVEAVVQGSGPPLEELSRLGVRVERTDPELGRAQYRVPPGSLGALARLDDVLVLRPPDYSRTATGSLTSEGDTALRAELARELGLSGAGIRIGVISDGVEGLAESIASGDAPALVEDLEFGRGGAEGTAMIEIIHDVAPGAEISFAGPITVLEFNDAVNQLSERNDIVVDDLAWFFPGDQQSVVSVNTAAALNNPDYRIRGYFNAVGNFGDRHYQGFYEGGPDAQAALGLPQSGSAHLFRGGNGTTDLRGQGERPYNEVFLETGAGIELILFWDDPWGGSENDYDLYLLDSANNLVALSGEEQSGRPFDLPQEFLGFVNEGAPGVFRVVVQNWQDGALPRTLELFERGRLEAPEGEEVFNFNTRASSVVAQSDAGGGVISLGAIPSFDPGLDDLEFFSSYGPTNNGAMKPELVAYDGVSVTGNGGFPSPFFGTSAAAPHAAAMAALLLEARPHLLAADGGAPADERALLRQILFESAIDRGPPGPDNAYGYGRIDALEVLGQSPVAAVTLSTPASDEPSRGPIVVTGTVSDLSGNPFPGVTVRFNGGSTEGVTLGAAGAADLTVQELEAVTNEAGEATVEFADPGVGEFEVGAVVVVAFIGAEEVSEATASLLVTVQDPVRTLSLTNGGQFVFWSLGEGFVAAEVFPSVKIAWLFDGVNLSWTSFVPELGVTNFALAEGSVLWIVSGGAHVITIELGT